MKHLNILALSAAAVFALSSCQKDLADELNEGHWNHERQIVSLLLENQVGEAAIETVDAATGDIELRINIDAVSDFSQVRIAAMELSYQATADKKVGDVLNFNNPDRTATITVSATTGEKRTYTIAMTEFKEYIVGKWAVGKLVVYGGTGPEYGGAAAIKMTDKSWCWNGTTGPSAEEDNTLTFTLDAVTPEGNTLGTCVNDPGPDGLWADFTYVGKNYEGEGPIDLNHFYRQIPTGTSTWYRDYEAGTITFTAEDGTTTTGEFLDARTESFQGGRSYTIDDHAFAFNLKGKDDWTNIYNDYDKFVKRPRRYFINVSRL